MSDMTTYEHRIYGRLLSTNTVWEIDGQFWMRKIWASDGRSQLFREEGGVFMIAGEGET